MNARIHDRFPSLGHSSRPVRTAATAFVIVATLGFSGTRADLLHDESPAPLDLSPTVADRALAATQWNRYNEIRRYAKRFRIDWELSESIYGAAREAGVPVDLAFGLVQVESTFRGSAIGPAGAIGFAQVQLATARWLEPDVTREDLFDRDTNLRIGFRYLRLLTDRYRSERIALLAYNRGPGVVERLLAEGTDPGNGYATRVRSAGAS